MVWFRRLVATDYLSKPTSIQANMKKILTFITVLLSIFCVNIPAKAEAAAAQEMYIACSRFTSALDEMNSILAGVHNKQTADAAAAPLKAAAIEFFTQLQVIQGIEPDGPVDSATEQRIMALLAKAEKGQVTFQAHCERLGDNACYGSEKMIQALLFIGSLGEQI